MQKQTEVEMSLSMKYLLTLGLCPGLKKIKGAFLQGVKMVKQLSSCEEAQKLCSSSMGIKISI